MKQGAVESPLLFGLAVEVILRIVAAGHENSQWLQIGFGEVAFMDDALVWSQHTSTLQTKLNTLCKELATWGLFLNPRKCQLLCWGDVGTRTVQVGGYTIEANPPGDPLTVMGLPFMPGTNVADAITCLLNKGRACFWANRELLKSSAPLKCRLRLLYRTVWAAMAWAIGVFVPTRSTLETLNTFLYQCVCIMTHSGRRPQEGLH